MSLIRLVFEKSDIISFHDQNTPCTKFFSHMLKAKYTNKLYCSLNLFKRKKGIWRENEKKTERKKIEVIREAEKERGRVRANGEC